MRLLIGENDLRRRFARFKSATGRTRCGELGTHFLDLGGLLAELGCESRYLFLLQLDHYLQLLNFVIQHGLALGARGRLRCATRRYARRATTLARANIPAKVVVIKVKSNFNNGAANRLEVIEDTTDEALCGPEPVNRDVGDADRIGFLGDGGTNELAHVSVTVAKGGNQVWSCPCTHDCVLKAINVIEERRSANCRVADAGGVFMERTKTSGRIVVGGVAVERTITIGCVVIPANVGRERVSASGTIEKPASVAKERINASSGVVAAIDIAIQGSKTRRRILVAGGEVVKRLETSAGVPDTSGAADEDPNAFAIVGARYVTVRVGTYRLRHRCKPKTDKHEQDEKETPS